MLNKYLQQVYRLLNDQSQTNYNFDDLIGYINEGRSQIASASQSIRLLSLNNTVTGQEIYPFSALVIPPSAGYGQVVAVKGISIIWGNFRYTLQKLSFSKYQALIRAYADSYQDVPKASAQFGQGVNGSIYMYPPPSDVYPMEWDCICLPADLATDSDPELIPYPWTDAVQYYAAAKAMEATGRYDVADRYNGQFSKYIKQARTVSQPNSVVNWYGRA